MNRTMLFLMLGYPGSGKTTTAEQIAKITGAVHLSSDEFHKAVFTKQTFSREEHNIRYRTLDYVTELLLSNGISVIYDANLNQRTHRQEKYDICKKHDVQPVLLWVKTNEQIARERATQKADDDPRRPYGNLKSEVFDRLVKNIQQPKDNEPFIEIDGTKVSESYIKHKLQDIL